MNLYSFSENHISHLRQGHCVYLDRRILCQWVVWYVVLSELVVFGVEGYQVHSGERSSWNGSGNVTRLTSSHSTGCVI